MLCLHLLIVSRVNIRTLIFICLITISFLSDTDRYFYFELLHEVLIRKNVGIVHFEIK